MIESVISDYQRMQLTELHRSGSNLDRERPRQCPLLVISGHSQRTGAKAEEERARLAYTSIIGGINTAVARARAELAEAQFDLDQTTTRAAGPGFVTQVSLRPGMYILPTQLRTAMLFVNTGRRDHELGAAFQQNSLQRVEAGDDAEVAFDAVPGRVFSAKCARL